MTSLIEHAQLSETGIRRPTRCTQVIQTLAPPEIRAAQRSFQSEYQLDLHVKTTFWANTVTLPDATKVAEKSMLSTIYGDIRARLDELRMAIYNQDVTEANEILREIEECMTP